MDTPGAETARRLEASGFTRAQAEALAEVLADARLAQLAYLARSVRELKLLAGALILLLAATLWQTAAARQDLAAIRGALAPAPERRLTAMGSPADVAGTDDGSPTGGEAGLRTGAGP